MNLALENVFSRVARAVRFLLLCLAASSFAFTPGQSDAETTVSKEYQLKAAFLYNFVQFVQWPGNAFTNAQTPFVIGILGDDPFGAALDETVQGQTVLDHKLIVQRAKRLEDLRDCQLIFVSKSEKPHLADILSTLKDRPVLTVSETQGFASHGGMINFYLDGKKVRFELNPEAAQQRGLKISSQLLSLGKIVESEPGATLK
jgi:hypothetical protein